MVEDSKNVSLNQIASSLRKSSRDFSRWKLYKSSKWSAEALVGMCVDDDHIQSPSVDAAIIRDEIESNWNLSERENDLYLLAASLFDCKEFDRCAYFLRGATNPCLKFLELYSEFLSWDKKTRAAMEDVLITGKPSKQKIRGDVNTVDDDNSRDSNHAKTSTSGDEKQSNPSTILKRLNSYLEEHRFAKYEFGIGGALLYYLKGILLKLDDNKSDAMTFFLQSLSCYSFNWTCWVELLECLTRSDEALLLLKYIDEKLELQNSTKSNVMVKFFKLAVFQEFSGNIEDFMDDFQYLHSTFPNFTFLKAQNALINYNYMDYLNSESLFDQIVKSDPYRLDDLDTYSNILYVMQKHSKLAYLAQFTSQVDKFRPETCCIVANYYSARQEPEKSIMYFRRALTLNKNCTSAWTLMGHEFVELKNSHAAIECYRRAVDMNAKDFKAWYGLGQAYEVLDMHLYSLYYFQKACTLKPLDRRMWQALAACYSKIGNRQEAINCYERALQLSVNLEQDTHLLFRLAELYEQIRDTENCRQFMIRCVDVEKSSEGLVSDETAKALLWLARFETQRKNYEEAYNYAIGVSHGSSQEIEEARAIARECRAKIQ
ncbi:hypothetical protein HG535_0E00910 [Zygotorulaspora mrakii]|uniref:Cdc23 domain-containing protein n=1 Tax=Zygotorulaspora mrakii TaxID=42260 RepID=A0A7H9B3D9_ZYGMR|nr:uncharacterized protein HG535_0E00910 [Zygotorulaspora mrakii]QLG73007.1 hypothetical protein HG535_0E00910 [Zygotorulaspora mrakii]